MTALLKTKPKCHKCWDKGFASQLVSVKKRRYFNDEKSGQTLKEIKNYCSCEKGKRLKRSAE